MNRNDRLVRQFMPVTEIACHLLPKSHQLLLKVYGTETQNYSDLLESIVASVLPVGWVSPRIPETAVSRSQCLQPWPWLQISHNHVCRYRPCHISDGSVVECPKMASNRHQSQLSSACSSTVKY